MMFSELLDNLRSADLVTLTLTAVLVLVVTIYYLVKPRHNYPPGPTGLPYFGSLFHFIAAARKHRSPQLIDFWLKKYGPIMSFKGGVVRFIYLKDGNDVKELYGRDDEYNGRPTDLTLLRMLFKDEEPTGLVLNNHIEAHKELRRFTLLSLRDFGVGKTALDERIQVEAEAFTQYLDSLVEEGGVSENIKPKVQMCVANILHNIAFGYRYDYKDPKFTDILQKLSSFFRFNILAAPENFIPIIQYIPFINSKATRLKQFFEAQDLTVEYVRDQIEEHRKTFDSNEVRDFVDLYLKNEQEGLSQEFQEYYKQRTLYFLILDLFRAGTDTTANTMSWSILYLIKNPQIQKQLHEEIDREIGDQPFKRAEKDKLKKVRAFVNEVLRHASIAYQGIPHTARKDQTYKGYFIPKDTLIFPALWSIHHDDTYWKNPEKFDIDRWFDENGKELTHDSHFMPFSTGKRACLGRQLALIELIMFLVAILQRFSFEAVQPLDEVDSTPHYGIVSQPKPFKFKVIRRT